MPNPPQSTPEMARQRAETRSRNAETRKPANRPECADLLRNLRESTPPVYQGLVDRIADGSKAATIKHHCLACVAFERREVTLCTSTMCALWPARPFQTGAGDADASTDAPHVGPSQAESAGD